MTTLTAVLFQALAVLALVALVLGLLVLIVLVFRFLLEVIHDR